MLMADYEVNHKPKLLQKARDHPETNARERWFVPTQRKGNANE